MLHFHYTTYDALESILRTRLLRMTLAVDTDDYQYSRQRIQDAFRFMQQQLPFPPPTEDIRARQHFLGEMPGDFGHLAQRVQPRPLYYFCSVPDSDSEHHWNTFAKGPEAVAIGIDLDCVVAAHVNLLQEMECVYDPQQQSLLIGAVLQRHFGPSYETYFMRAKRASGAAALSLVEEVLPVLKEERFAPEREVRLVYRGNANFGSGSSSSSGAGKLKRFVEVPIPSGAIQKIIVRRDIAAGPFIEKVRTLGLPTFPSRLSPAP